jgi:hypothetical protein
LNDGIKQDNGQSNQCDGAHILRSVFLFLCNNTRKFTTTLVSRRSSKIQCQ